jgi:hypothetical protein
LSALAVPARALTEILQTGHHWPLACWCNLPPTPTLGTRGKNASPIVFKYVIVKLAHPVANLRDTLLNEALI